MQEQIIDLSNISIEYLKHINIAEDIKQIATSIILDFNNLNLQDIDMSKIQLEDIDFKQIRLEDIDIKKAILEPIRI